MTIAALPNRSMIAASSLAALAGLVAATAWEVKRQAARVAGGEMSARPARVAGEALPMPDSRLALVDQPGARLVAAFEAIEPRSISLPAIAFDANRPRLFESPSRAEPMGPWRWVSAATAGPGRLIPATVRAHRPTWQLIEPEQSAEAAQQLLSEFMARGYTMTRLRGTADEIVPRVILTRLPDLNALGAMEERKALFIQALLPLILAENSRIEDDRALLIAITERVEAQDELDAEQLQFLADIADRYNGRPDDLADLLRRVDVIPPSLAIAQAALESGWGTSRGARMMQSLFGEMTGPSGARIRGFPDLASAVRAYALILNSHRAHGRFRQARADMRARGEFDPIELVGYLERYSTLGAVYIRNVRQMIRDNDLRALDGARLESGAS